MNIELKNVQHCKFQSEETICFQCSVWIDGKKSGTAHNDGHGGCTDVHLDDRDLWPSINDYFASLPKEVTDIESDKTESGFFEMQPKFDYFIDDLVQKFLITKDCKKLVSKRLVFTEKGKHGVFQSNCMTKPQIQNYRDNPDALATLEKEWNVDTWLTFIPLEDAVVLYQKHTTPKMKPLK